MITKRDTKGRISKGSNLKHGLCDHPVYDCWVAMKARCNNPQHPMYKHYGARGITVCDRWQRSFEAFLNDMGMPEPSKTIDRIDVNGNYEPNNCRWLTIQEQQKNRRDNNKYVGVHFEKSRNKWHADIKINGRKIFLGRFKDLEEAAKARERAEAVYWNGI